MGFPSDQTNFDHTFGGRVTFYKPIDAEDIVAKTVTIVGRTDSVSLTVKDSSSLSTLSVSNQSTFKNIVVTGIATVNNLNLDGELRDGDGHFGSAGQVLSSDGTDTKWINTSSANVGSASNVGTNENGDNAEQYVTFVGAKTGNNPIRVDEGIKYNPSTDTLTVGTLSLTNGGIIPAGGIIIWSGAANAIPSGWALCNGQTVGALTTPDLRDRFIVGAGNAYSVDDTGGSADATLVEHSHGSGTYTADSNGAHTHNYDHNQSSTSLDNDESNRTIYPNQTQDTTSENGTHTHPISGTSGSQGSSAVNANLPPYYALCYIMKT